MMTSTDFAKFGSRERELAAKLLNASIDQGFPDDFYQDEINIMMNINSGNVFFTNSDFQVAMMNGDKLESFYHSPYEGMEGFYNELKEALTHMTEEDKEWFKELRGDLNG